LNALAGRGESPWAERAALRLAELDLEHDKAIDAVRRCAQLHARPGTLEPAAILRLWGAGLASLGQYDKAARCLAGQPPE
jgi:hypothetical protein